MPKVCIIILNYNGWPDTLECLESLDRVEYDNFEIILIDNASRDSCQLPVTNYQRLKINLIYNKENLGFAGGNNQGIKLAQGRGADYVLLLNNDTTVEPDFLGKLVEAAQNDSKIGIAGPMILFYDQRDTVWFGGGKVNWLRTRGLHLNFGKNLHTVKYVRNCQNREKEVDYITGCCLLIKREVIEKIGLLSEDYFLYYEDTDWCLRVKKAGWLCGLVPAAKIYHKRSRSATEFSYPYIYYHSRNGLILSSRFGFLPLAYLISIWIFVKQMIKLVIGYKRRWAKPVMKGVTDFWRGKRGKLEGFY